MVRCMLNLKKALATKGIPQKACAGYLDITERTFYSKLAGLSDFTYGESRKIKELLPEYDIEFLLSDCERSQNIEQS